jgi:hypothetical protein
MNENDSDNIDARHLCPLPHRGHAPQVHPPATICDTHTDTYRDRVTDIRRLWGFLPELQQTARDGSNQTGSKSQAPTRLDIVALTDPNTDDSGDVPNAVLILTTAANWVAHRRRLTVVTTPTAALSLLQVHHLALSDHPYPTDPWRGLQRVWLYLRRLAGENRHVLGYCQEPDPDDDQLECGGALYYTPNSLARPVVCSKCADSWSQAAIDLAVQQMALAAERDERTTA